MDINENQKDFFKTKGFIEKEQLIKYDLEPYNTFQDIFLEIANKEDLEELALIDEQAFGNFWKQGKSRIMPAIENEKINFLKYVENNKIIAYTIFSHSHIMRVAVLPQYQGKGIGKKIMLYVIDFLYKKSINSITLNTQITNAKSRPLYENLGFKETALTYVMIKS